VALVAMNRSLQRSLPWLMKTLALKGERWSLLPWPALLLLLLAVPLPALATGVLRVGVLDGSPPCSLQKTRGQWQGRAVELWELIARREGLAYLMRGYPNPRSLLEATRADQVDIGVGCLTMAPERVGRYRFSLPFQERGLALMLPAEAGANSLRLLSTLVNTELLKVIGGYLLAIGLISSVVWLDEHRNKDSIGKRDQLRRFALIYQVMASGPGTNMIVTRTRGHALVLLAWLVRIIGASMIVSTITLDALREPAARGFQPRRLTDLTGLRIAVRPGSVSENLLKTPPLAGRVKLVNLSALEQGPMLLLQGKADGVLADEQQLDYVLEQTPPEQRSRLRLALKGAYRESQAFVYSPNLDDAMATRLDRAISQAKRDGLLP
jgi:polar amino acid transport system substrate-binding protein